ncbi:MAG TPA: M10 family metallopeptidase C-terminal domain-containing protein [Rubellimicrobium sp.]|nr:M10 family metallopeptidase C-terminal domain-containing protein [Rubellimicrobium sp.]
MLDDDSRSLIGTANNEHGPRGLFYSNTADPAGVWAGRKGVSFDIDALERAMSSVSTDDDFDLIAGELCGADTFDLSTRGDLARGYGGNDTLNGSGGADPLYGGDGNDKVNGGTGNDRLFGEAGQDKFYAGAGRDIMDGGDDAARDTFLFDDGDSAAGSKRDTILHFAEGSDILDLSRIDSDVASSQDNAFAWSDHIAASHSIWWTATADGVVLSGDVTGDAKADFEVVPAGAVTLTSEDVFV